MRGILLAVALLVALPILSGCSPSTEAGLVAPSSGLATQEPLATEEPLATAEPITDPTAKPNAAPLNVKVTAYSKAVRAGSNASMSTKTNPGAECGITVEYASGPSTAAGLDPKRAGTTGSVVWKWKVGSKTTKGSWPITVQCDLKDRSGTVTRNFTVK